MKKMNELDVLCYLWSNIKDEKWFGEYAGNPTQYVKNMGNASFTVYKDSIEGCLGYLRSKGEDVFLENLDKWGFNDWMKDFDKTVRFEYVEGDDVWIDPVVRIYVD